MAEHSKLPVGQRIRQLREQRGLSLRALASQASLSINAISLIERGEASPTVSSLQLLAAALGVPVTAFFEPEHEQTVVFVRPEQRLHAQVNGILMESLGIGLRGQQIEPFRLVLEPGSGSLEEPITHPGEEFAHCLEGEVAYRIGSQHFRLLPGDSLLFSAGQPHSFHNPASAPAVLILVFCAGDAIHLARQRHLDVSAG